MPVTHWLDVALAVCTGVFITSYQPQVAMQPAQDFVLVRTVEPLHLQFAVVEVTCAPVVSSVVVVLLKPLIEFSNQPIVAFEVIKKEISHTLHPKISRFRRLV